MAVVSVLGRTYKSLSAEDRIIRAKAQLEAKQPFFAYLLMHMNIVPATDQDNCNTMSVDSLDTIRYNEKFVLGLNEAELTGVLCHEITHRILNHIPRMFSQRDHQIGAVAADVIVNWLLAQNNFQVFGSGYVPDTYSQAMKITLDPAFDPLVVSDLGTKSVEELYGTIEEHLRKQQKSGNKTSKKMGNSGGGGGSGSGQGNNSGNNSGNKDQKKDGDKEDPNSNGANDGRQTARAPHGFDDHIQHSDRKQQEEDPNGNCSSGDGELPDKWRDIVAQAYVASKMRGKLPAGMEGLIGDLFTPKIPWRQKLYRFITSEIIQDFTYKRPHKKSFSLKVYLPNVFREKIEMVCHIDTSGSVSEELMQEFMTEIFAILNAFPQINMTLVMCDAAVQSVEELTAQDKFKIPEGTIKRKGYGGTSHMPVIDWINQNRPLCKLFISLTDGYSDIPEAYPNLAVPAHSMILLPSADKAVAKQCQSYGEIVFMDNKPVEA